MCQIVLIKSTAIRRNFEKLPRSKENLRPNCVVNTVYAHKDSSKLTVRNIPKFTDRANWSHDTFQPMIRRAFYQNTNQNIAPVIKKTESDRIKDELTVLV